jgi:hypothetical protein
MRICDEPSKKIVGSESVTRSRFFCDAALTPYVVDISFQSILEAWLRFGRQEAQKCKPLLRNALKVNSTASPRTSCPFYGLRPFFGAILDFSQGHGAY